MFDKKPTYLTVKGMLDAETIAKLGRLRTVFLIDEIHRSNSGDQHEEMTSIFDELQDTKKKTCSLVLRQPQVIIHWPGLCE